MAERKIDASELPEGSEIRHDGTLWTAFPSLPWLLPDTGLRWQSDHDEFADDDTMTRALAAGGESLGVNQQAIDEYHAIVNAVRERRGKHGSEPAQ